MSERFQVGDVVRLKADFWPLSAGEPLVVSTVEPGAFHVTGMGDRVTVQGSPDFGIGSVRLELVSRAVDGSGRTSARDRALLSVLIERVRQDDLFGPRGGLDNQSAFHTLSILTEELGELAQALNDGDLEHAKEELVQVAAVALAWLEAAEESGSV